MRNILTLTLPVVLLLLFGLIWGCSDSDNSATVPQAGEGRVQIFMIDSPGNFDEVNVEVVEVRVHRTDADSLSGWHTISTDTTYVNLLDLTEGNYCVLADTTLPAGHYSQVRLILGDGNNVVVDGQPHSLRIPSSGQSGLKLIHGFAIEDGALYGMTLDFDAHRSIHITGNGQYMMRPVIRLMVNALIGSLSGTVDPAEALASIMAISGADTAVAYADTLTGRFLFPMLNAGVYDLEISATAGEYGAAALAGVVVTAGQETDVGTIVLEAD